MSCAKCLVLTFNGLTATGAIIVIAVASHFLDGSGSDSDNVCRAIIIAGSFLILFSIIGSFGALRENEILMWVFSIFLTLLVIVDIVNFCEMPNFVKTRGIAADVKPWNNKTHTAAMASMEREFKCCGWEGPDDYPRHNMTVPDSCYFNDKSYLYVKGCAQKLPSNDDDSVKSVKIFLGISMAIKVITLVCSIKLALDFRNRRSGFMEI